MESFSFWVQFGVAGVCLFGLAMAVWRSIGWTANEIVKPGFNRGLKLVDSLEEVGRGIVSGLQGLDQKVERIERKQEEHFQVCRSGGTIPPPKG